MNYRFAHRLDQVPPSYLDELFRVSADPTIISFAGGLPSSALFDTAGIYRASCEILEEDASVALQYTRTDGYQPLREYIAERYRSRLGIPATADKIQIVNGSQQCLDLFAKIFLNAGDHVGMERPGYLGAIEAFSLYEPVIDTVTIGHNGPDLASLEKLVKTVHPPFFYGIPNSQNPSGLTYSQEIRQAIADMFRESGTVFFEDDAFGELFFDGKPRSPVAKYLPDQTALSGSFSKIIAPGMRIGWIYAPQEILSRFNIAKQAADLHSNFFCQKILHRYLTTSILDNHIRKVVAIYAGNCNTMCDLLDDVLPSLVHTAPEGGMFLTVSLPAGISSRHVFEEGIEKKIAVMPGLPFYVDGGGDSCIRLNFSSPSEAEIHEGIHRLALVIRDLEK
jgi:2-aminoadipate transaminase